MTRMFKILAGTAIAATAIAGTASTAAAQPYYPYDDRYDYRDRGGINVGDIAAGVAAVGAIAGAVNAVTGRGGYAAPYGYGAPYGYSVPRYGYGYPQGNVYGYGNAYGGAVGYGAGAAVNSCSAEAQRFARGGQVQVRDVDQVSGGRFRVRGIFQELQQDRYGRLRAEREGFSCLAYGNGQIQDFDS